MLQIAACSTLKASDGKDIKGKNTVCAQKNDQITLQKGVTLHFDVFFLKSQIKL